MVRKIARSPFLLRADEDEALGARWDPRRGILDVVKLNRGVTASAAAILGRSDGNGADENTHRQWLMQDIAYQISRGLSLTFMGRRLRDVQREVRQSANFRVRWREVGQHRGCRYFLIL